MRKKTAVVSMLIVAVAALAWVFYPRDGKLRPVSRAEGLKLLTEIRAGVNQNQKSIRNGCGRMSAEFQINMPETGSCEQKIICDLSFAGDTYKVKVIDNHTRNKAPEKSFSEKLKQFGQQLIKPRSVKPVTSPVTPIMSGRELAHNNIYSGDKKTLTQYDQRKKQANIYEMGKRGAPVSYQLLRMLIPWHNNTRLMLKAGTGHIDGGFELQRSEPVVLGRQRIGSNDCIVIEQHLTYMSPTHSSIHIDYSYRANYWVCPQKGYCTIHSEYWGCYPWHKQQREMLLSMSNADVREYKPGVWVTARNNSASYGVTEKGRTFRQIQNTVSFDPNFQLNVPKSKLDLNIKLPKGTRVQDEVKKKSYVVK